MILLLASGIGAMTLRKLQVRLRLSRAKHPSLGGHAKLSRRVARWMPYYSYQDATVFRSDGAPAAIGDRRRRAFDALADEFAKRAQKSQAFSTEITSRVSDLQFTNAYRVPFQSRTLVENRLEVPTVAIASEGVKIKDLDGEWAFDLSGSYGVNLLG